MRTVKLQRREGGAGGGRGRADRRVGRVPDTEDAAEPAKGLAPQQCSSTEAFTVVLTSLEGALRMD